MELTKADAEDYLSSNPDSMPVKLAKDWISMSEEIQHLRDLALAAAIIIEKAATKRFGAGDTEWTRRTERWRTIHYRLMQRPVRGCRNFNLDSARAFLNMDKTEEVYYP